MNKIRGTVANWENEKLGADPDSAVPSSPEDELLLDAALELKPISIRMPVALIKELKIISAYHGIGYQPLMRDILSRFARAEIMTILNQQAEQKALEAALTDEESPAARQLKDCA